MRFWSVMLVVLPLTLVVELLKAVPADAGAWRWIALLLGSVGAATITAYTIIGPLRQDANAARHSPATMAIWWLLSPLLGVFVGAFHQGFTIFLGLSVVTPLVSIATGNSLDSGAISDMQILAISLLSLVPATLLSLIVAVIVGRVLLVRAPNRGWASVMAGVGFAFLPVVAVLSVPARDRAEFLALLGDTTLLIFALSSLPWAALYALAFLSGAVAGRRQSSHEPPSPSP